MAPTTNVSAGSIIHTQQAALLAVVTHQAFWDNVIDICVVLNATFVGLEVDMPDVVGDFAGVIQVLFCVIYIAEFVIHVLTNPKELSKLRLQVEYLVALVAIVGVFVMPEKKVLWRCSVFRLIRGVRIVTRASTSQKLADLWLVLAASWKMLRTIRWLVVILFVFLLFFGGTARGLIYNGPDDDELNFEACGGDAFRTHLRCIDIDDYFGSIYKTSITMLQALTLDRWAAHIVRPLAGVRPEAAIFIFCFVAATMYGLMSISVGVLVWSTVEIAKNHDTHRDRVAMVTDKERIKDLREYFEQCLTLEDRTLLDLREIKEAMALPNVKNIFEELALPVVDVQQLWAHLDQHSEGEITLDQFQHGCESLLEPAKRFDMASLSARMNGRAAFAGNLAKRCDESIKDMDVLFKKLSVGFAIMRKHVLSDDIKDVFPEVGLRRKGKMKIPHPDDDPSGR